jgi:lipoprotein-releasing system permease protein
MALPFFIARRHLFHRHKIGYISFISIISTIGLAVGVAALIITISILNGFENVIKEKLIGFDAHIRLRLMNDQTFESAGNIGDYLQKLPGVRHVVRYIHNPVMIRYKGETDGVVLEGLNAEDLNKTLNIDQFLKSGQLTFHTRDNRDGIIIGQKLANYLGAQLGDQVYLFVLHPITEFGNRPRIGSFAITGIYESGISDYDDIFIYTSLEAAQKLYDFGDQFSGFQIILDNPYDAAKISKQINATLGYPYRAMSWLDLHYNLFEWLRIQRLPILIIFGLIALVAIFNIVSSLMMIVIEKTRDIGVLKSMGVNHRQTGRIFLIEGAIIGTAGTLLGFLLAGILTWIQIRFNLISIPEDVYFMSQLPIQLEPSYFLIIGSLAILCSILATIYPSTKAVHLAPAEAIRYE